MGIFEQALSGSNLTRQTVSITNTPVSGSLTTFGHSYILLNVTVNNPCRIRLYSDSSSVAIDDTRTTASFDLNPAVGLVVDTLITSQSYTLNFDPPIIGTTFSGSTTWYNISGSGVTASFTYFPIEFSYNDRQVLSASFGTLPTSSIDQGNLVSPKAFLILSASSTHTGSRLRLYSRDISTISSTERSRQFGTVPDNQSSLITDMVFDSASYAYKLTPVLQAYNLTDYAVGQNFVGYFLENTSGEALSNVTASIYIYPIEN